jgi:hypothetical protein
MSTNSHYKSSSLWSTKKTKNKCENIPPTLQHYWHKHFLKHKKTKHPQTSIDKGSLGTGTSMSHVNSHKNRLYRLVLRKGKHELLCIWHCFIRVWWRYREGLRSRKTSYPATHLCTCIIWHLLNTYFWKLAHQNQELPQAAMFFIQLA